MRFIEGLKVFFKSTLNLSPILLSIGQNINHQEQLLSINNRMTDDPRIGEIGDK